MMFILALLCLLASVHSESRFKRQLLCNNNWSLPNNPCGSVTGQTLFPHPRDSQKYLQCDAQGRMYVIQCPSGMVYNRVTASCQQPAPVVTQPPLLNSAATLCSAQNLANGQIYFGVPNDNKKFIECTRQGTATILTCPNLLIWNQARQSCVTVTNGVHPGTGTGILPGTGTGILPGTGTGTGIGPGVGTGLGTLANPCRSSSAVAGKLYYPHPDVHKYIQCDTNGDAYVETCPGGLVWNTVLDTCYAPYQTIG